MAYAVEFSPEAIRDLDSLGKPVAQRILRKVRWLSENFETLATEPLSAEFKGLFKLKVGSYRVIYDATRQRHLLTIHLIGHRKDIYKKR